METAATTCHDFMRQLIREAERQQREHPDAPALILPQPRNGTELATLELFRQLQEANNGEAPRIEHPGPPEPARILRRRKYLRRRKRS